MTSSHLLALYLGVGVVAAIVVAREHAGSPASRLGSALVACLLWPLWAPIALGPSSAPRAERDPLARRLHAALDDALTAAAGSPLEALLTPDAAARIRAEIERATGRLERLSETLARPGFDPDAAEARVRELEARGAPPRTIATARLHRDGVARVAAAKAQDLRALDELADALVALRSQIVLAQVEGGAPDEIVSDLWARVEGLGAALEEEVASRPAVDQDRIPEAQP